DYNTVKAIQQGKVDSFMGFMFFWWNFLIRDTDAGTCSRTVAWARDGLILANIGEYNTKIDILPTRKYSTGIYSTSDLGAVRMDGDKVHECLNLVTQTLTPSSAR
ncbi:MAG: hypothetical protein IMZ61_06585, partial [Planctomycetes bacterium]|nr:hypothetical protein [Planctomycetota bacterium]